MGILLLIEKGLDTEDCWNIMLCRKLKQINGDNPFFPIALHVLCLRNILEPDPRFQFWMCKIIRINIILNSQDQRSIFLFSVHKDCST